MTIKVDRVFKAENEPPAVRAYLFTHFPYTPNSWTVEEINQARVQSGLAPHGAKVLE